MAADRAMESTDRGLLPQTEWRAPPGWRSRAASETGAGDPEAFAPLASGRDRLQFVVFPGLREIECIRRPAHRLEADKIPALWRVNDADRVLRSERHRQSLLLALDRELGATVCTANQARKEVV